MEFVCYFVKDKIKGKLHVLNRKSLKTSYRVFRTTHPPVTASFNPHTLRPDISKSPTLLSYPYRFQIESDITRPTMITGYKANTRRGYDKFTSETKLI